MVSHCLGHVFQGEGDVKINLLERAIQHFKQLQTIPYFMAKAVIFMMYGDEQHMKVFSM